MRILLAAWLVVSAACTSATAQSSFTVLRTYPFRDKPLEVNDGGFWSFGVTRNGEPIHVLVENLNGDGGKASRVLFIPRVQSDEAGKKSLVPAVARALATDHGYPPKGDYYNDAVQTEQQYLWRWIGMTAPDLVIEIDSRHEVSDENWYAPVADMPALKKLAAHLPNVKELPAGDDLISQLVKVAPCNTGTIPALRVVMGKPTQDDDKREVYPLSRAVEHLAAAIEKSKLPPSPARVEIQKRLARSPREVADQLLAVYGKQLGTVQYIPALALVGRLRQDRINGGDDIPVSPIVLAAVAPYVSGTKPTIDGKAGGSGIAGHLVFGELASLTGEKRYIEIVKAAADLAFDADGKPREAMPAHNEMSDAVFMGCPILAQAGKLTGDEKYFEACLRNLRFMQKLCVRNDGIYRHSPLDEAAWGRGNGFPALGLAWSLSEIPESFAGRAEILAAFQQHMAALLPHQDATGCWHQVIDRPESYREFTCTAMITFAMARGVRLGWLDREKYAPAIAKGWDAIRARIAADGSLVDVCAGTGKQKSLRDYYDRTAILGRDDRGGAMALMVTTEMQLYLAGKK